MTSPTSIIQEATPRAVFAEIYRVRNRPGRDSKLNAEQVAEALGADIATVKDALERVFFAELLHMSHFRAKPDDTFYTWHYGVTALGRRIVAAVGLDSVTDELIASEYNDAMAWRPRRQW
jgi:hypothetical protein